MGGPSWRGRDSRSARICSSAAAGCRAGTACRRSSRDGCRRRNRCSRRSGRAGAAALALADRAAARRRRASVVGQQSRTAAARSARCALGRGQQALSTGCARSSRHSSSSRPAMRGQVEDVVADRDARPPPPLGRRENAERQVLDRKIAARRRSRPSFGAGIVGFVEGHRGVSPWESRPSQRHNRAAARSQRALRRAVRQRLSNMKAIVPSILSGLSSASLAFCELSASGPWPLIWLCRLAPPGAKPPRLRVVGAVDQAHGLAHHVAVEPGRAERVLGHHPARREDHEVGVGPARHVARAGQHGEDRRIGMVEADRADRVEAREIVATRREIAVPGDDVERRMVERRRPQRPEHFWTTSVGSSLSSNQATGVSKSRGLARPLAPIGPRSGSRNGARSSRRHSRAPRRRPRPGSARRAGRRPIDARRDVASGQARSRCEASPGCGMISSSPSASTNTRPSMIGWRDRGGPRRLRDPRVRGWRAWSPCRRRSRLPAGRSAGGSQRRRFGASGSLTVPGANSGAPS